jgi:hypothetical protein
VGRSWSGAEEVVGYDGESELDVHENNSEGEDREGEESGKSCEEGDGECEDEQEWED